MEWTDILRVLIVLVMSAVIGIFTNYIAVKMLFRPYRAKYIGKFKIPFTPGIIPRRQGALARAMGNMISESLVRTEDIKKALLSDEISHTVAKGILAFPSIRTSGESLFGDSYDAKREVVLDFLTDRIMQGILAMNVGEIISNEASAAVSAFTSKNPLLGMFVNDAMVAQLAAPIGDKVTAFLEGDGKQKLKEALSAELEGVENKAVAEWIKDTESFERIVVGLYRRLVDKYAASIASQFHIAEIVEEKINSMPPEAIEQLFLSIMKKELNAIIWLGGAIGLVLGLVSALANSLF